jgi:hypothetical protein
MNIIVFIIILTCLIIYINNKEDFKYYFDIITYNPYSINVDINNNSFEKKLNILILSTDDRDNEYIQLHKKSLENYSNKNNYTFLFEKTCTNLPLYYCKYQRILQLMEQYPNYDYFLWIDSDTIINKKYISFPLESMIEQVGTDIDMIYTSFNIFKNGISREIVEKIYKPFIAGFYMFKNNNKSKKILQDAIDYIDYSKWDSLRKGNCNYAGECYEEAAMFYSVRNNEEIKSVRITGDFMDNQFFCNDNYFIIHNSVKSKATDCFKKLS